MSELRLFVKHVHHLVAERLLERGWRRGPRWKHTFVREFAPEAGGRLDIDDFGHGRGSFGICPCWAFYQEPIIRELMRLWEKPYEPYGFIVMGCAVVNLLPNKEPISHWFELGTDPTPEVEHMLGTFDQHIIPFMESIATLEEYIDCLLTKRWTAWDPGVQVCLYHLLKGNRPGLEARIEQYRGELIAARDKERFELLIERLLIRADELGLPPAGPSQEPAP